MRATELALSDQIRMLSGSTIWKTQALPGVPSVVLSDGPHGLRAQTGEGEHLGLNDSLPATCFPTGVTMASTWDADLLERVGVAVGAEARALGVALVLGPGMNIKRHPRCGRNFEYLSEDPLLTGRLAAAMVRGIQSQGVGACVKHFAVNNQEDHRFVVDALVDERTLREIYLAAFEHVVREARPWSVMAAYNLVNGEYCTDSERLLTRILRDEWGFDGFVVSDWGATNDRVAGVRAGMDLEMPGGADAFDAAVAEAVASGELDAGEVAACAQRILDFVAAAPAEPGPEVSWADHDALARTAAAQGSVLLTNDGLLPMSADGLAVIGEFARNPRFQGAGSSRVNAVKVTSLLDALRDRGVTFEYAAGYRTDGADANRLIDQAVRVAAQAESVVLMVGLPAIHESEGFDREGLRLPPEQDRLIEQVCSANPRTVVVLSNGAPVLMPWVGAPAAILEAYLGGQASGAAVADVLFGDAEPGGRLAETFPVTEADIASDPYFPGQPHQVQYREGLAVGYRHATTADLRPAFCFGHGLGYTTFGMGPVSAPASVVAGEDFSVRVPVTNTGPRAGSTVIQVYAWDRTGRVGRPRRELAGFVKVRLAPGETVDADVAITGRALAFYDVDSSGWRVPQGRFDLEAGWSSEDIAATVSIEVTDGFTGQGPAGPLVAATDEQFAARLGHAIPPPRPVRPYSRNSTIEEISGNPLGRLVRSAVLRVSGHAGEEDPATAKMISRSVDELPLRAVVLLGGGKVSMRAADGLVDLLNRRPDRAAWSSVTGLAGAVRRRLPG